MRAMFAYDFAVLLFVVVIIGGYRLNAQHMGDPATPARELDALLQDYAFRALVRPRTGRVYPAEVPANVSGIQVSVIRLRSGSLRSRGLQGFNEFDVPVGVVVSPYVVRLALVYQNLGNWSSRYYSLRGYTFLAPVVGILAYDAGDLSATNLPELNIVASLKPISIKFGNRSLVSGNQKGKCVHFNLNGSYEMADLVSGNLCSASMQGHFTVVAVTPVEAPATPSKKNSNKWKIVVGVVGGFFGLILLILLIVLIRRYRRNKQMRHMVERSNEGVVLQAQRVGNAQLPVASMIRTRPVLENEYTP